MSSATIQARITAFESLSGPSSSSSAPRNIAKRSDQPVIASDILGAPISSAVAKLHPIAPFSAPVNGTRPASASPPHLDRKESLIDLKDWVLDVSPSPPRTNGFTHTNGHSLQTPTKARHKYDINSPPLINLESPPKPRGGPTNGHSSPKAPPLPPRKPSLLSLKAAAAASGSTSSLPNAGRPTPPPLPARNSDSLAVHTYPPPPPKLEVVDTRARGHTSASSISSFHSVSLSSDTDLSTPDSAAYFITTYPVDRETSSINTNNADSEGDSVSLDESFENVSATSLGSPTTVAKMSHDWDMKQKSLPPKLPQRPSPNVSRPLPPPSRTASGSSSSSASPKTRAPTTSAASSTSSLSGPSRRVPPPPPSRSSGASDHSSIMSTNSTFSLTPSLTSTTSNSTHMQAAAISRKRSQNIPKLSVMRPIPVPSPARKRYEIVFTANVIQRRRAEKNKKPALLSPSAARKTRQAAGWRGLSVDLITGGDNTAPDDDNNNIETDVGPDEVLEGYIVRHIWSRSKLEKEKLRTIWLECDISNKGVLSCDAFVKGMWRIDEELRRIQMRSSPSSASSILSFRRNIAPPIPRPKPKNILT